MSGAPTGLRQVRSVVTINGVACGSLVSWEAETNEFTAPDTCSAHFALSDLPAQFDEGFWADTPSAKIEIFVGVPLDPDKYSSADLTSVFFGDVDDPVIDWVGTDLHLTGRDLSAKMIDAKTSEKYINKTASEIASILAGKYGLTPVITATTAKAGKLYAQDHVQLKDERTEWDLLTWLARVEGFRVYVKGRELHFEPIPDPATLKPFIVKRVAPGEAKTVSGNYVSLSTGRSLTIAGDIKVTVKSWGRSKKPVIRSAVRTGRGSGSGRGTGVKKKQEYEYSIPNLSPDQAQQKANTLLAEVSKHIMRLNFGGAASEDLHKDNVIALEGTGTSWDQTYFPETIHRQFDPEDGYSWTVSAKNKPTADEPTL